MFDDPKKELHRLEQELLAAEEEYMQESALDAEDDLADILSLLEEEAPEAETPVREQPRRDFRQPRELKFGNGFRDLSDELLEEDNSADLARRSKLVEDRPREKGIKGLVILACLETLAILGLGLWWLLWLM